MPRMGQSGSRWPYYLLLVVAASLALCRNAEAEDFQLVTGEAIINYIQFYVCVQCEIAIVDNVAHTWGVFG